MRIRTSDVPVRRAAETRTERPRAVAARSAPAATQTLARRVAALEARCFPATVKPRAIVVFVRQLSTMIDAGLPLVQSLEILSRQRGEPVLRAVLADVKSGIESGETFAESLAKHPRVFDELFVSLVEAGELGGILDTILNRLATFIEKGEKIRRQVRGALVYPAAIVSVAVMVTAVILVFVIPTFEKLFEGVGAKLPAPTLVVIAVSHFVQEYVVLIVIALAAAAFAVRALHRTEPGRRVIDKLLLEVPVLGLILAKAGVARFTRTLGTMIGSGVPILESLAITARTAGNRTLENAILATRASISEGRSIAEPLAETEVFPEMVVQMIAVGEATGSMDTMLAKIADFYEDEVDVSVKALTSLLEPMLMIGLGATVGGLIIAMYLPIFTVFQHVAN
ncbi:MAG: type II secretion system F family protein [Deltaproteobacteria bacterium]|nr:type II secretion system F family protein [Deltaproteobacteria bacterium]